MSCATSDARCGCDRRAGAGFEALTERLSLRDGTGRDDGAMAAPDGALLGWSVRALTGGRQLVRFRLPESEAAGTSRDDAAPRNRKAIGAD